VLVCLCCDCVVYSDFVFVVLISLLFLCVVYWSVCACVLDCVVCVVLCLFWSGCACVHVCVVYSDFVFLFVLFFLCLC
jgi:hypothetical protein